GSHLYRVLCLAWNWYGDLFSLQRSTLQTAPRHRHRYNGRYPTGANQDVDALSSAHSERTRLRNLLSAETADATARGNSRRFLLLRDSVVDVQPLECCRLFRV